MHILLTGGTGLIGRHLCPFLLNHHKVTVLTRNPIQTRGHTDSSNALLSHSMKSTLKRLTLSLI